MPVRRRRRRPPKPSTGHTARPVNKVGEWRESSHGYITRQRLIDGKRITEYEHRVVMGQMIGRDLLKTETVHHINGNKTDNRPENLELWVTHQPSGQRPADLLRYAYEIIARYGDLPSTEA